MKDLTQIRKEIDAIDSQILALYEKRLGLAEDVANYKIANHKAVFDKVREEEKLNVADAQREQTLNTIVYSVFSGAKRYHAGRVCGTQTNGRELTVREAMSEALIPCPDCSPPVVQ